jgi:hypothetical protein
MTMAERARFRVSAGALTRAGVKRQIRSYAYDRGVQVDITEDRGLLDSELYFAFTGTGAVAVARTCHAWVDGLSDQ